MKTLFLILFSIFFTINLTHSQVKNKDKKVEEKQRKKKAKKETIPENIEVFKKNYLFRPRFVLPSVWFSVSGRLLNDADAFTWKPAMPRVLGGALKIKKVYISAAFKLPSSTEYKHRYGNTSSRNIYLNIQGRTVLWTMFYRDYKGFYLTDYQKYYPSHNGDSLGYPQLNDLRIIEGGLNIVFNFNKSFSLNAAFSQSERQKKGAGSFLMSISERYQRIEGDTNIVPILYESKYSSLSKLKYGNFFSSIFSIGSGYQFVKGKFHLTPIVMVGTGFQFQKYVQAPQREKFRINMPTYANFKTQIGYNGDFFFTNLIYSLEFNSIPIKETRIRLIHNWIELGLGVRF